MEIISSRLFHMPRQRLYQAFADPKLLQVWWGPEGFSNDFKKFELKAGGDWLFTMTGPEGQAFEMVKKFTEVVPHEKIVLEHYQPMHHFTMTMTFDNQGGRTLLTWKMVFHTKTDNDKELAVFLAQANEQNFDRLEHILEGA